MSLMDCYVMESAHTNIYIYPSSMIPDTTSPPPSSPQLDKHVNCGYYGRAKAVSSLIASFINTQHLHFTILEFTFISNSPILLGRLSNKIGSNVKTMMRPSSTFSQNRISRSYLADLCLQPNSSMYY